MRSARLLLIYAQWEASREGSFVRDLLFGVISALHLGIDNVIPIPEWKNTRPGHPTSSDKERESDHCA
ncbi:hypothetical protein L484_008650 [Morus notabilis]|uniref:Uncharacterized protein n=1 Tax=Morus notabilis TaxID=981085 RepID=W9RUY5_9ROSA|nr:hypothetical protein L484_008650 [Morus notabilis]